MAGIPGKGGVKGRSGRRPMSIEMKRHMIIDRAWDKCHIGMDDSEIAKNQQYQIATTLVARDMSKPIVIDQSTHKHFTQISVKDKDPKELINILMGRSIEPQREPNPTSNV